ncbi:hypothetical protein ACHAXA_010480 [Cyclostephanos tholiformis]|uniref:Transmembrane protein n=1 Tax=Cyclostephanos tholiformis TaxID=382380 RepID=A0ABD3R2W6_9STRA
MNGLLLTMGKFQLLLSLAGEFVRSINPSLLDLPPPAIERSGHDVCYLGPNGEDSHDRVVYCRDLMEGHRAMVGSYYIHPERHVIEYVAVVVISLVIIRTVQPALSRHPKEEVIDLNPPPLVKIITTFIYACQLAYKLIGYPGKILMMGMPCNVIWTMYMALCYFPLRPRAMHVIYQLMIPYTILAIVAVATPDTSDITLWMEVPFFFFMHYALIAYPAYFLWSGRISALSFIGGGTAAATAFLGWWILACAYFGLFYFGVAVPLSLVCGINLNYMLSPPPTPGNFLSGPNFRLLSTLACALAFFVSQLLVTSAALFGRWAGKVLLSVSKKRV